MAVAPAQIKDCNVRYHDHAASEYDAKWGIGYDQVGQAQVVGKLAKALGDRPGRYGDALEIGAGTGYFSLNLLHAGVIDRLVATDISPGMLARLRESAADLKLEVETACCDAAALPYPDASFDLVFGHAVLHHLPDLPGAFDELRRVLRPGGTLAFCGEPSRHGHRIAALPKRLAVAGAPAWRRMLGVGARHGYGEWTEEAALEMVVDVHAFTPGELTAAARAAGFEAVRVSGEELTANWFGWTNRTLESTAPSGELPRLWYEYAYRGYLALQVLDRKVLERRLPTALFYNLLLAARVPGALGGTS
jgi:ubiquinone/menaquinone biosynthesis C-methylase UbiE